MRADIEIPAELILAPESGEEAARAPARIGNLGPEGAFVKTWAKVAQGTRVRLHFGIESHPIPFVIDAEVRWTRDGGIGLQFLNVPPYDRSVLDDYCQRRIEELRGGAGGGAQD